MLVPLTGVALAAAARRAPVRRLVAGAAVVLGAAVAAFFVTTPYFFLDLGEAVHQLRGQADVAGSQTKLGQAGDSGPLYYLESLTWGLGWLATAAAAAGAVLLGRRDPRAPGAAAGLPGRAVPVPERAVAVLRALAAARLPDAGAAGRRRAGARGGGRARPRTGPGRSRAGPGVRDRAVPAACGGLPLDGRPRPPRHPGDRAPVARLDPAPRAARRRGARGARAVVLADARWPPEAVGRPAAAGQPARPGHPGVPRPVHRDAAAGAAGPLPRGRLLHRGHDGPHPRPRRGRSPARRAGVLRAASSASPTSSSP